MGNLGGPEILVIFFVALIVLGPNKLPDAARQVGKAMAEIRRVSGGFQREMRQAMQEPLKEVESDFMVRSADLRAKKKAEAAAADTGSGDADSDNADPDNADPDNADPDNADPDNADPDNADPDKPDPDKPDPDKPDPDKPGSDGPVPDAPAPDGDA